MGRYRKKVLFSYPNAPCYKCEERHFNCFSSCFRYYLYKMDIEKSRAKRLKKIRSEKQWQ